MPATTQQLEYASASEYGAELFHRSPADYPPATWTANDARMAFSGYSDAVRREVAALGKRGQWESEDWFDAVAAIERVRAAGYGTDADAAH